MNAVRQAGGHGGTVTDVRLWCRIATCPRVVNMNFLTVLVAPRAEVSLQKKATESLILWRMIAVDADGTHRTGEPT